MSDSESESALTKAKRPRTDAQVAAFEKAKATRQANLEVKKAAALAKVKAYNTAEEKKLVLKAIKDKLNGEAKPKKKVAEPEPEPEPDEGETTSEDDAPTPPPKANKKIGKPKKQPTIIYESATESESEPEVIVVKKKKPKAQKSKAKTVIVQEDTEEEDDYEPEPPKPVSRPTKSQQHHSTKVKIEKPQMQYYFG
jgi:hypothetical protein